MRFVLSILVAVLLSVGISSFAFRADTTETPAEKKTESVYERVTRTKILRCGYITWPPLISKNVKTGKMEGLYFDLTEEIAKGFGWTVEWKEEVPLTDFVTALQANRVDMMCAPLAPVQQRTQWVAFSKPHFYAPFMAFTRIDEHRFDNNLEAINDPSVRLSTMEGELTSIIARTLYPKAPVVELSAAQGGSMLFENVATGKADVIFQDPFTFSMYDKQNPNKLRKVPVDKDVGVFYAAYAMKLDDGHFKTIIDAALTEFLDRGYIEKLAKDYQLLALGIYLPADGYKK